MQVRQVLIASVLAATAMGAMSQEIDRSETLQARSLAARQLRAESPEGRTRASVAEEARDAQAGSSVKVGELADGLAVHATPSISWAKWRATETYGQAWLNGDRRVVGAVVVAKHD